MKTAKEWTQKLMRIPYDALKIESAFYDIQTDAQAHLLDRIKALEGELSTANDCVKGLEGNLKACEMELDEWVEAFGTDVVIDACKEFDGQFEIATKATAQLDQAHTALKCALEALEQIPKDQAWAEKHLGPDWKLAWSKQSQDAIALIHACGIGGETKEHPALAILRRNLGYLRTDSTREDYLEACRLLGLNP